MGQSWELGVWGGVGEEWLPGIDLPETDNRGYSVPVGPSKNKMYNFAHARFVVISDIKTASCLVLFFNYRGIVHEVL